MTVLLRPLEVRATDGASSSRRVTWLELFFDLVFVAAVAQVGEPLREELTLAGIARFAVLFALIWWAWIGNSVFATRFDTDDGLQRGLTLIQMFAVVTMAANAGDALESRSSAGFAAAYAAVRFVLVAQYARARQIAVARGLATRYMAGHGVAAALWLASPFVAPPLRWVIWATAMTIDLGTPWMAVRHSVAVPPDSAHLPERFGLFTLILLGESVVAVMHGMQAQETWSVAAASAAFLGLATAFVLWWWYFDGASGAADRHVRSHRDAVAFHIWSYAHLPLYLGISVAFAAIARSVHHGAHAPLHGDEGLIVGVAIGVTMAALVVIRESRPRSADDARPAHRVLPLALAAGLTGLLAPHVPSVFVIAALTLCCVAALGLVLAVARRGDGDARLSPGNARPHGVG